MASAASSRTTKNSFALKQKAMLYYKENGIPSKMEEILNTMFYEDPPDVHGYLVNYFSQFTKPATLKRFQAMQVFDSTGMPTIQTDVLCTINNKEKKVVSATIPFANIKTKPEEREKAEVEIQNSITEAIKAINSEISEKLVGHDPREQSEVDEILLAFINKIKQEEAEKVVPDEEIAELTSPSVPVVDDKDKKKSAKAKGGKSSAPLTVIPNRPLEIFCAGSEAVAAVSQAVCACAAISNNIPIYRHVTNLGKKRGALNEFRLPLPMVTIIQSGKFVPGKVNCVKEYMLVPGIGMPLEKSIEYIQHIYQYVAKSLATKLGPAAKFVNESGALCPQLETPTQALDLLQEAVNAQGLTIGEDMYLAINAAAHDFFDHEKGRYEVITSTLKSPDDMVDFWADIVLKYPSLIAIIDPVRAEDLEQWLKLSERISENVFVLGDRFHPRPGLLEDTPPVMPTQTSGAVLYLEQMNSVTDLINSCNTFHDMKNEVVISTNQGDTIDTFIVDFAVGVGARFLKIGGPCRGERSCKLNRLVQISQELEPPLPKEEEGPEAEETPSAQVDADGGEGPKVDEEEENLKIDVGEGEEMGEGGKSPKEPEQVEDGKFAEEIGETQAQAEQVWGQDEPARLKLHEPFVFPFIEVPAPVPESDREAEENNNAASPSSKPGK